MASSSTTVILPSNKSMARWAAPNLNQSLAAASGFGMHGRFIDDWFYYDLRQGQPPWPRHLPAEQLPLSAAAGHEL